MDTRIQDIRSASIADLRAALAQSIKLTTAELVYMAQVWEELRNRGENMANLKAGLMRWLPEVANNHIEPELVVRYAGSQMLIARLSKLSITKQRALIESGTVEIPRQSGRQFIKSSVMLEDLKAPEINRLVSSEGRVRSYTEQLESLTADCNKEESDDAHDMRSRVKIDSSGEYLLIGSIRVSVDSVLESLGRYYRIDVIALIEREATIEWSAVGRSEHAHPGSRRDMVSRSDFNRGEYAE